MTSPDQSRDRPSRGRTLAFLAIVLACVVGAGAYVALAVGDQETTSTRARVAPVAAAPAAVEGRRVLVRAADPEDSSLEGEVAVARLGGGRPRPTGLTCQRSYLAGDRGICLTLAATGVDYNVVVFDRGFSELHSLALDGLPSRARVSPDGRLGAVTGFVTGHSYANSGQFSTRTRLLDLRKGRWIADLEDFQVFRGGRPLEAPDFNFWGVTFARGGRGFYATLSTGAHRYLVHGNLAKRRVEIIRDRVECPSLSPDGRRIAYKRTLGEGRWRPHVLDLRTGADHALAETRSIDDQIEWLDNDYVLYGDGDDVFLAPADGAGRPRRVLARAASPAALL